MACPSPSVRASVAIVREAAPFAAAAEANAVATATDVAADDAFALSSVSLRTANRRVRTLRRSCPDSRRSYPELATVTFAHASVLIARGSVMSAPALAAAGPATTVVRISKHDQRRSVAGTSAWRRKTDADANIASAPALTTNRGAFATARHPNGPHSHGGSSPTRAPLQRPHMRI
jgi:hypothetical protein